MAALDLRHVGRQRCRRSHLQRSGTTSQGVSVCTVGGGLWSAEFLILVPSFPARRCISFIVCDDTCLLKAH